MKYAVIGVFALCVSSAHAVVLFQENFDSYGTGTDLQGVNGWQTQNGPNPPSVGNAVVQSSGPAPQSGSGYARVNAALGTGSNTFRVLYRNMASTWAARPSGSDNILVTGWVYVPSTTTGFFNLEL